MRLIRRAVSQQHGAVRPCDERRKLLRLAGCVGLVFAAPQVLAGAGALKLTGERRLRFFNLHTGESVDAAYWAEGKYIRSELADINRVLRDHRSGDLHQIDLDLLDTLWRLHTWLDAGNKPFQVISGYRSPATNAKLRQTGGGVAKKSLHMLGQAVDIRLQNRRLDQLHRAALALKAGGVGYYEKSNFVHLDVGRVRRWQG